MLFSTDGLITRSYDSGGSDRVIHLLTAERGRISVLVKGGKSFNGKQTACSQPFTYGNYEIYQRGDKYWMRGGSVITPFYELSSSIVPMALASYLCELTDELTDEELAGSDDAPQILRLILNSLYAVSRKLRPYEQIKAVFELRMAVISGYSPNLDGCSECGKKNADMTYLDVMNGRLICSDCLEKQSGKLRIPTGVYADEMNDVNILCRAPELVPEAVRYAISAPVEKMLSFRLASESQLADFASLAETYILNHLGRGFNSLDFYKSVKNM